MEENLQYFPFYPHPFHPNPNLFYHFYELQQHFNWFLQIMKILQKYLPLLQLYDNIYIFPIRNDQFLSKLDFFEQDLHLFFFLLFKLYYLVLLLINRIKVVNSKNHVKWELKDQLNDPKLIQILFLHFHLYINLCFYA